MKEKANRKVRASLIVLVILCVLVLAAVAGAVYAGYRITESDTNLPGVHIGNVDVGGLTQEETRTKLANEGWSRTVGGRLKVMLPEDVNFYVDRLRSGADMGTDEAVALASAYGHGGTWIENLMAYLRGSGAGTDVTDTVRTLDDEYIAGLIDTAVARFDDRTADPGMELDEDNEVLVFIKGAGNISLDRDAILESVRSALLNGDSELTVEMPQTETAVPDFGAILEKMAVESSDAYYDGETGEIVPETVGVRFDTAEAVRLWNSAGTLDRVEIPVDIIMPDVTAEFLEEHLFKDLLGTKTTSYAGSTQGRITNINLAASKLNGVILMPGEEFSYNGTVGERTAEAGYQYAPAYNDGVVVQEIGGGICQVSSTLFCSALLSQMEVTDRTCHYFAVNYLSPGFDATVSWPKPDLKFVNTRNYPVRIVTYCNNSSRKLTIEIWGLDEDGSYAEMQFGTWMIYDSTYPDVQTGNGAVTYLVIYDRDGNKISRKEIAYSTYYLHDEDIKWPVEPEIPGEDPGGYDPDPGYEPGGEEPGGQEPGGEEPGGEDPGGEGGTPPDSGEGEGTEVIITGDS